MSRGTSWKTRNNPIGYGLNGPRQLMPRKLRSEPQFTLEGLYISPFTQRKRYDEDGQWQYVPVERNMTPTGVAIMDDYLRYLASGQSDMQAFADRHGLKREEVAALVFVLTGMKGVRFRQLYQMRLADDLLRFTDLKTAEVARRSGLGSANNLNLALRREYDMSPPERRRFLRRENDVGRFRL